MHGARFDDLSTRLAVSRGRRPVMQGIEGGLVAGLLALVGRAAVAAPCPSKVRCGHGKVAVCCLHAADRCSRTAIAICQSSTLACPVGGDASHPTYQCTDRHGFACDCATEQGTGNAVCIVSGGCADCARTPCPAGQRCVAVTSCTTGTACAKACG
jgi:hypothetical protein